MSSAAIIAGVGAAVAIGGTIYGITQSQAAIDAANSVKLPKFTPIDIKGLFGDPDAPGGPLENLGLVGATDLQSVFASQLDWVKRFPQLNEAKQAEIGNVLNASEGKLPSAVDDALKVAGVKKDFGSNPFEQAINLDMKDPLAIEKGNRNAYSVAMGVNPEIQIGATGADAVNAMEANTEGQFNFNETLFGSKLDAYNASIQQSAQNLSAGLNTFTGLANIGSGLYQNYQLSQMINSGSNALDPSYYYGQNWRSNAQQNYSIPGGFSPIG